MENRLNRESSLYLKQHAEQPVNWYAWGEEPLRVAKELDRPVLVSIGYSACHWCHVMAHECFDDSYIADIMNKHFVCVKVDREEHPAVDQVYMEAVQMIQQQGGWPLNVFCLPDGRPFFGGTYFPPEDRGNGLIPWPQLLMRIVDYYKRSKAELMENAESIQKNMMMSNQAATLGGQSGAWNASYLMDAVKGICGNHDDQYGGFGGAPKFPPAMTLNFLQACQTHNIELQQDAEWMQRVDEVIEKTLKAMAHGGLYDQFGGGFARYSVDAHWLIPHFEKMLYDNALLIESYSRASQVAEASLYESVVEETVDWLNREMLSAEGAFFAALDADSEGEEGRFYVWDPEEVDLAIGPSAGRQICSAYNITKEGNFENGQSNPALVDSAPELRSELQNYREQLRQYREQHRVAPGRDEKISVFWNALMIRALAEAAYSLNKPEWLKQARRAVDFLWERMVAKEAGQLQLASIYYRDSGARFEGNLHDYATLADALLSVGSKLIWIGSDAGPDYIAKARSLIDVALERFSDGHTVGYYFTPADVDTPVTRKKEWFDNATPAGNSVLLHALSALYTLTADAQYLSAFQSTLVAYTDYAQKVASGIAHALEAIAVNDGVTIVKVGSAVDQEALRKVITKQRWRRVFISPDTSLEADAYQVCVGLSCRLVSQDLESLIFS